MRMTGTLLALILMGLTTVFANEGEINSIFQHANAAYRAQHYQQADSLYQTILQKGFESATLYYNIGNCKYKLGDIGAAILFYRKALKLNPNDADAAKNLKLARLKVMDKIELPPKFFLLTWWEALTTRWSYQNYLKLALVFWWVMFLMAAVWVMVRRDGIRAWSRRLVILSVVCFLLTSGMGYAAYTAQVRQQQGVVVSSVVTVRSAPEENATEVFILHAGTEFVVADVRNDWLKIRLADGKEGWVPRNETEII